jgi:hypothetical protein
MAGALLAIVGCYGDAPPPTGLQVPTSLSLSAGALSFTALEQTTQLSATVRDQGGAAIPDAAVTWTTSSAFVAEVSPAGLVEATGPGVAWIRASSGTLRDSASVSVEQAPSAIAFFPAAVHLAGPGDSATVVASVLDAGGSAIAGAQVTWSSLDEDVATIDDAGFVTGVATGATTLRAEVATSAQPVAGTVDVAIDDGVPTGPAGGDVEAGDGRLFQNEERGFHCYHCT